MNRAEAELVMELSLELEVVEMKNHTPEETEEALNAAFLLCGKLYAIAKETLEGNPSL